MKVKLNDEPSESTGLSHTLLWASGIPDVEVWGALSWLVHVTLVPTGTFKLSRVKFTMLDIRSSGTRVSAGIAVGAGGTSVGS